MGMGERVQVWSVDAEPTSGMMSERSSGILSISPTNKNNKQKNSWKRETRRTLSQQQEQSKNT